jgi:hypothetical protein
MPNNAGGANLAESVGTVEYVTGTTEGLKTVHLSRPVGEIKRDVMAELEAYRRAGLIEKLPSEAIFL